MTGVIDYDAAGIEAFGMYIWGLYECFFGSMEDGRWFFYDMLAEETAEEEGASHGGQRTVRQVLEDTFWESMWASTPPSLLGRREDVEQAVKVSLSVGIINRYFIQGMMDEIDLSKSVHRRSLEYARGILPQVWKS